MGVGLPLSVCTDPAPVMFWGTRLNRDNVKSKVAYFSSFISEQCFIEVNILYNRTILDTKA